MCAYLLENTPLAIHTLENWPQLNDDTFLKELAQSNEKSQLLTGAFHTYSHSV